jgi:hypothetical protein
MPPLRLLLAWPARPPQPLRAWQMLPPPLPPLPPPLPALLLLPPASDPARRTTTLSLMPASSGAAADPEGVVALQEAAFWRLFLLSAPGWL